jgi:outer membrane biogenesis lipoprotein LolB
MTETNWAKIVFAFWLLCFIGFLLTGCAEKKAQTKEANSTLYRQEDSDVVCYQSSIREGLWCYRKDQGLSCPAPGR